MGGKALEALLKVFHYGMLRVINFVLNQPYYDTMLVFNFVLYLRQIIIQEEGGGGSNKINFLLSALFFVRRDV